MIAMLKQISLYAENKKGTLERITDILLEENINILGSMTDDGAEYGVNRMVVSDPEAASKSLQEAGYLCHTDWVAAAEIGDECGSLNRLLDTLTRGNVNLDYLYVTYSTLSRQPVAILRTPDIMEVEAFLSGKGYRMLEKLD